MFPVGHPKFPKNVLCVRYSQAGSSLDEESGTRSLVQIMEKQHRNVLVLSGCQATMQTITASMVSVTGLAGFLLAENKGLATVPLTCYVLGSAITTIPASILMKAVGRRAGFQAEPSRA